MDKRPKILIIEDDILIQGLIQTALRQYDFDLLIASNGEEAYERYYADRPDLMLLDILLPYMNGLELLRKLQQENGRLSCQVIVISALGFEEIISQAISCGACDFLLKPFSMKVLRERIFRALEATGFREPARQSA